MQLKESDPLDGMESNDDNNICGESSHSDDTTGGGRMYDDLDDVEMLSVSRPDKFELGGGAKNGKTGLRFQTIEVNGNPVWVLDDRSLRKDIDHCLTCGSYALRQEFFKPHYCVEACYLSSPQWMEEQQQLNAPIKLFKCPALPSEPNPFRIGQMMEAIDPENQSLFCVVSIAEIQGWRLKLHFEGFCDQFDFWVDCDSLNIFPPGWCAEIGFFLQPPGDFIGKTFNWHSYLVRKCRDPAPRNFFQITKENDTVEPDILGTKLEAVDIRANNLIICVATVTKVMGHRFLVHFDSWDNIYDYWADLSSPFVFPIGYCERNRIFLTPPNGYENFNWERYLSETNAAFMPSHLFQPLPPVGFKRGMRIESVDLKNPRLIRPAVIHSTEGHLITIRYEGWPDLFDCKMNELSSDLHPVGYCETTGHVLEHVPKTSKVICPNLCGWKGNVLDPTQLTHCSKAECPYLMEKERVERVVILIPPGSSGASPIMHPPHVLPGLALTGSACPSPTSILPTAFLKQTMTVGSSSSSSSAAKKVKREDILAKMMILAQTVLKEERPPPYLFDEELDDLTPIIVRDWDVDQTHDFVSSLPNCGELAKSLREQLVDGDALLLLSKKDFIGMSHTIHWMKLYYALTVIRSRTIEPSPDISLQTTDELTPESETDFPLHA